MRTEDTDGTYQYYSAPGGMFSLPSCTLLVVDCGCSLQIRLFSASRIRRDYWFRVVQATYCDVLASRMLHTWEVHVGVQQEVIAGQYCSPRADSRASGGPEGSLRKVMEEGYKGEGRAQ